MATKSIERLSLEGFTAFDTADIVFGSHINVIVGENGSGKSHLLKLLYSVTSVMSGPSSALEVSPTRTSMNATLANKLAGVFRPEQLGRLTNRRRGRSKSEVSVAYAGVEQTMDFSFASNSRSEVKISSLPGKWLQGTPVFLPTRELLSIYPGFVSLYNERRLEFDETWRDTADLLGRSTLKGPREGRLAKLIHPLEQALGGSIVEENGRFYLKQSGIGKLEMHLVAEGLRKIGMLARLITSGTLQSSGYLFWDEPESNLNPQALKAVARTIIELSRQGIQVFIATHSLFLLRELEIQLEACANKEVKAQTRFIGLSRKEARVEVSSGPSIEDIGDITALDEELIQSDRYLEEVP